MRFKEWLLLSEKIEVNGVQFRDKLDALKYIYNNHPSPENLVVSYTEINKIGINPKSKWATPIGIYFYPLKYVIDRELNVPFAGNKAYINVCEIVRPNKILHMQKSTEPQLGIDLLNKTFTHDKIEQVMEEIGKSGSEYRSNYSTVWLATQLISNKNPISWNTNLRKLGIDGFFDHGTGTIHTNEPTQGVALTANALKVIHVIENVMSPKEKDIVPYEIQQNILQHVKNNNINNLSKLLKKFPIPENAVYYASELGNLDMVKFLVNKKAYISDEAVYAAIKINNLEIVKYLVEELLAKGRKIPIDSVELSNEYAEKDVQEFLVSKGAKITSSAVKDAIDSKEFSTVKYFIDNNAEIDYKIMEHLSSLIKNNPNSEEYIDIFKYIVKNSKDISIKQDAIAYAIQSENENLLNNILEDEKFEINSNTVIDYKTMEHLSSLIKNNPNSKEYIDIFKYIVKNSKDISIKQDAIAYAIQSENENLLNNILEDEKFEISSNTVYYAMKQGKFDVAKYLLNKVGDKGQYDASLKIAAASGNKEMVDILVDKSNTPDAAIDAAENGHFNIAKYIVDKKGIPSYASLIAMALNYAEKEKIKDYSDVFNFIKHLVEEKKYPINRGNVTSAILTGEVDLVKYLLDHLDNSVKINESEATKYAIISKNIDMIKYLVEDKKFKLSDEAIGWAVNGGDINIIRYLINNGAKISKQDVQYYAKELGKEHYIVKLLEKNINQ